MDGQEVEVEVAPRTSYQEAAEGAGISIPHICVHDALNPPAVCRTYIVEVEGTRTLPASCVA